MSSHARSLMLLAAAALATACAPPAAAPGGPGGVGMAPAGEDSVRTLDFLTLNIWHNQQDWPARLEVMAEQLEALDPDVICLQEVLQDTGLPNQAETLAARLGYTAHFASWDSAGSVKRYGNAVLTRDPVLEVGERRLEPADDYRVVAHVRIAPEPDTLDVYCTHLHHTAEGADIRRTQALDALEYIDETRGEWPILFAGDFNAPADAPELSSVRGRFADAYGVVHADSADAVTTLNPDMGHRFARIDHVFYRSGIIVEITPRSADVVLDQPSAGGVWPTDHFGVHVTFALRRAELLRRRR